MRPLGRYGTDVCLRHCLFLYPAGATVFLNFPKCRTPMADGMSFRGCLSGGGDIFSKSVEKQGGANRTFATGGRCHGWQLEPCPYELEPLYHFSLENSHPETRHQGVMFRSPWAFVGGTTTLRYEPCTQFINVSQRALHIYFIEGCRVCPLDAQYKVKNKNSDL